MLVVETIAKIRRAYFGQKKPIKQIWRELKVSRKVVRKVIRSGLTEFTYERSVQPMPKIGPLRDDLDRLLEENAHRSKRERLTLVRISRSCGTSDTMEATTPCGGTRRTGVGARARLLRLPSSR